MPTTYYVGTDGGDTMALDPLQSKVSACGQGQICDPGDGMAERFGGGLNNGISVGAVLFVMRNGKPAGHELDNLAYDRHPAREPDKDVEPATAAVLDAMVGRDMEVGSI
jgi:hypothetical protein